MKASALKEVLHKDLMSIFVEGEFWCLVETGAFVGPVPLADALPGIALDGDAMDGSAWRKHRPVDLVGESLVIFIFLG
jgi:hypothetical protein